MLPETARRLTAKFPTAHWVLCRADNKAPSQPWRNHYPDGDELVAHLKQGGLVGVVPATILYGFTVLDVDEGNADAIAVDFPPLYCFPSRRPGGAHLWYLDDVPRPNAKWRGLGCAGEVRSGNGYVVLWPGAAEAILNGWFTPDCVPYADVLPHITVGAWPTPSPRATPSPQKAMF